MTWLWVLAAVALLVALALVAWWAWRLNGEADTVRDCFDYDLPDPPR